MTTDARIVRTPEQWPLVEAAAISTIHVKPYRLLERDADGMYRPLARFVALHDAHEAAAERAQHLGEVCA